MTASEYRTYIGRQTTEQLRVIHDRLDSWRTSNSDDECVRLSRLSMIGAEFHSRARQTVYGR